MSTFAYHVVDVFTTTQFGGNPLAVITDARGLSDEQMQRIAAEFGFSETTFVLPPADPQHTAQVRIFTPVNELEFAGHPNVGTAYVLGQLGTLFGRTLGDTLTFEERAGLVEVSLQRRGNHVERATITAPRTLERGPQVDPELIAACVSLSPSDIVSSEHPPLVASVGLQFVITQLASRAALAKSRPNLERFAETNERLKLEGTTFSVFLYVPTPGAPEQISARMFAPLDGLLEDPATGSASAALAALRASLLPAQDAELALTIEQGVDMGRPSTIHLLARKEGGIVTRVEVSGASVTVMRGEIILD